MRSRRPITIVLLAGTLVALTAAPARAAWSAAAGGDAAGRAVTMPTGLAPTVVASGADVAVRWPAAMLLGTTPVAGYRIDRRGTNGQVVPVTAACAGTITTTTCVEHGVPAGTWTYTDTPLQGNWVGGTSPPSSPVTVDAG